MINEQHKPQIEVYWNGTQLSANLLQHLLQGIEEEGVPYHVVEQDVLLDAIQLSVNAALDSLLEVGIGCDHAGNLALHHRRLADNQALFQASWPYQIATLRLFGSHAARLVKGLPFKLQGTE